MKKLFFLTLVFGLALTACDRNVEPELEGIAVHPPAASHPEDPACRTPGSLGDPSQRDVDHTLPICDESSGSSNGPVSLVPEVTDKVTESNSGSSYEEGGIIYPPADTDEALETLATFTRLFEEGNQAYFLVFDETTRVGDRYPFYPNLQCDFRSVRGEPTCYDEVTGDVYTYDDFRDWLPYVLNVDVMTAVVADEVTCDMICVAKTGHLVGLVQDEMGDWLRQYCPGGECGENAARFGYR